MAPSLLRCAMFAVAAPSTSAYSLFGSGSPTRVQAAQAVTTALPAPVQTVRSAVWASQMSAAAATDVPVSSNSASGGGKKKVFVLGGDGFCGWPTALHLSDKGHEVVIIDNLSRRKIDVELGASSLTPISTPEVRVQTWNELTGRNLRYVYMDLAEEYDGFLQLIKDEQPDTMVHFAEQVAARHSTVWPSHV